MMRSPSGTGVNAPPVDARVVAEDSGYEIVDGRLQAVAPADEAHGRRHSKVNALLEAHVTAEYDVACDMLTRTSETTDLAPDASVYPVARDPETGGRQLEALAFEVLDTQSLSSAADRARRLADRGVRRVFAVDVPHQRVFEWSSAVGDWRVMADAGAIDDEVFATPLPVAALVVAAKADDAMAAALLAKDNPVLADAQREAHREGLREGLERGLEAARIMLHAVLDARGLHPDDADRDRIAACDDIDQLRRWAVRAAASTCAAQALTDEGE